MYFRKSLTYKHLSSTIIIVLVMVAIFWFLIWPPIPGSVWSRAWREIGSSDIDSYCIGNDENWFAAIRYSGNIFFDPGWSLEKRTSENERDTMLVRISPDGAPALMHEWCDPEGSITISAIDANQGGDVCIIGDVLGTVVFDDASRTQMSVEYYTPFICIIDSEGGIRWLRTWDSARLHLDNVLLDDYQRVFITGRASGRIDLDPGLGTIMVNSGLTYGFVASFDANGDMIWHNILTSQPLDMSGAFLSPNNGIILGGYFREDLTYGNEILAQRDLLWSDIFLIKINCLGELEWKYIFNEHNRYFAFYDNYGLGLQTDKDGNVYLAAHYVLLNTSETPGDLPFPRTNGAEDCFIAKLSSIGELEWVRAWGGRSVDFCTDISLDADNNIYACGAFSYSADFDPGEDFEIRRGAAYDHHNPIVTQFMSKFDADGSFEWVRTYSSCDLSDLQLEPIVNDNGQILEYRRLLATSYLVEYPEP